MGDHQYSLAPGCHTHEPACFAPRAGPRPRRERGADDPLVLPARPGRQRRRVGATACADGRDRARDDKSGTLYDPQWPGRVDGPPGVQTLWKPSRSSQNASPAVIGVGSADGGCPSVAHGLIPAQNPSKSGRPANGSMEIVPTIRIVMKGNELGQTGDVYLHRRRSGWSTTNVSNWQLS